MIASGAAGDFGSASPAFPRVSFPPSPSPRRLSSRFSEPSRPVVSTRHQLPWVSLHGRLIGAHEATSAHTVGKGLGPAEAVAWELFTPLHRVLLVAIVAIASAETRRSRRISQLQKSVDIRDEELRNMQIKLDELCEQMKFIKNRSQASACYLSLYNEHTIMGDIPDPNEVKLCHCGSRVWHLNPDSGIVPLCSSESIKTKDVYVNEPSKERLFESNHDIISEQEERRMSDLSDFWSVASSVDIQPVQLSTLAEEQELYNLRKECEEKDATIKELTASAHASSVANSKRIAELEDVIRRKNMIITKLKKDMLILEQQIIKFTRLRRQSSSSSADSTTQLPHMTENVLYDMSSSSPSSSDCDSPERDRVMNPSSASLTSSTNVILRPSVKQKRQAITLTSSLPKEERSISPFKENRMSSKVEAKATTRQRQLISSGIDFKKAQRRSLKEQKNKIVPQNK